MKPLDPGAIYCNVTRPKPLALLNISREKNVTFIYYPKLRSQNKILKSRCQRHLVIYSQSTAAFHNFDIRPSQATLIFEKTQRWQHYMKISLC